MGPHKGREKLSPGWDSNSRTSDFDHRCGEIKPRTPQSAPFLALQLRRLGNRDQNTKLAGSNLRIRVFLKGLNLSAGLNNKSLHDV